MYAHFYNSVYVHHYYFVKNYANNLANVKILKPDFHSPQKASEMWQIKTTSHDTQLACYTQSLEELEEKKYKRVLLLTGVAK